MTKKSMEKENEYKKGLWTVEEDRMLTDYGIALPRKQRCGKSCRLRWMNYLSPTVNRSNFTQQEEDLIIRLHNLLGNRWSLIAKRVPGRTDNQVKNYWNTHLSKKHGINHQTHTSFSKLDHQSVTQEITNTRACHDQKTTTTSTSTDDFLLQNNKATQKVAAAQEESIMDDGFFNSLWVSD